MKKLIPLLALMALASGAYAQGVITFANNVLSEPPDRDVYNFDGTELVGTNYAAQLYYSTTDADSLRAHTANPNRFRAAGSSLAGTWSTGGGANRTLTGGGVGTTVFVAARVWDLNLYPTYEAAVAAGGITGTSTTFTYVQRLTQPIPATSDTYMDNFTSFTLVPEPSVIGLGLVGIGALFMLRRRKA